MRHEYEDIVDRHRKICYEHGFKSGVLLSGAVIIIVTLIAKIFGVQCG